MLKDKDFYNLQDNPTERQKKLIWEEINKNIKTSHRWAFHISDMRSFYYGIAAAVVLFFLSVGVYTTISQMIFNMKPGEVKLDTAYQSAIKEFEKVVPAVISSQPQSGNMRGYINSKWEQLRLLDNAILQLRNEIGGSDLTPLKQARLRQLYVEKLKVLQEMVDQGEIEL